MMSRSVYDDTEVSLRDPPSQKLTKKQTLNSTKKDTQSQSQAYRSNMNISCSQIMSAIFPGDESDQSNFSEVSDHDQVDLSRSVTQRAYSSAGSERNFVSSQEDEMMVQGTLTSNEIQKDVSQSEQNLQSCLTKPFEDTAVTDTTQTEAKTEAEPETTCTQTQTQQPKYEPSQKIKEILGHDMTHEVKVNYVKQLLRERKDWIKLRQTTDKLAKGGDQAEKAKQTLFKKFWPDLEKDTEILKITEKEFNEIFDQVNSEYLKNVDKMVENKYGDLGIKTLKERDEYFEKMLVKNSQERPTIGDLTEEQKRSLGRIMTEEHFGLMRFKGRAVVYDPDL